VNGTIEFQDVRESVDNVTVYVRVQDVTYADARATTVAERVLPGVYISPGASAVAFTVDGIPEGPGARYILRIHADVDGDGTVSRGDYISTQSYPVQTTGRTVLTVHARRVS
jgi:uncharacterized lipoprotein YbaY